MGRRLKPANLALRDAILHVLRDGPMRAGEIGEAIGTRPCLNCAVHGLRFTCGACKGLGRRPWWNYEIQPQLQGMLRVELVERIRLSNTDVLWQRGPNAVEVAAADIAAQLR